MVARLGTTLAQNTTPKQGCAQTMKTDLTCARRTPIIVGAAILTGALTEQKRV